MDDVFFALTELMEAHHECSKARDEYQGYSWGYHGQKYEDAVNEAKKRFEAAFRESVLKIISEARGQGNT